MGKDKVQHLRTFEELGDFFRTKPLPRSAIIDSSHTKYIHYGDIHRKFNGFINKDVTLPSISDIEFEDIVEEGDLIFADASEDYNDLGKTVLVEDVNNRRIISGLHTHAFRPNNSVVYPTYIKYFTDSTLFRYEMRKRGQGISVLGISKKEIDKIQISLPEMDTQKNHAKGLRNIDMKIGLLERKLENLKLFKKGFLMKYFAELETNVYKEVFLNDISTFTKGKGLSKSDLVPNGSNHCILYGELYTKYNEVIPKETSRTNVSRDKMVLSVGDEVLLPSSTTTTAIDLANATAVTEPDIILGGDINIIKGDFDNIFMAYYMSYFKKIDIAKFGQGITIVHLYNSHLKKLRVRLPEIDRQKSFSEKVVNFDEKISLTKEILETLKQFKKGLLQKMFV